MSLLDGDKKSALPKIEWNPVVPEAGDASEATPKADAPAPTSAPDASVPRPSFHLPSLNDDRATPAAAQPQAATPVAPQSQVTSRAATPPVAADLAPHNAAGSSTTPAVEPASAPVAPVGQSASVAEVRSRTAPSPVAQPAAVAEAASASPAEPAAAHAPQPVAEPAAVTTTTATAAPAPAAASVVDAASAQPAQVAPEAPQVTVTHQQPNQAAAVPMAQPQQYTLPQQTVASRHQLMEPAPTSRRRKDRRRSGGGGIGLLLTLVVLAGLIAAGFVYGRPYLFPDEWNEATKPYAEAIENVRGDTIPRPFEVVTEPSSTYAEHVDTATLGEWEDELAMWRSFGLVDGTINAATIGTTVGSRPTAFYSPVAGQVFVDAGSPEFGRDEAIVRAAAAAALDQEYGWSGELRDDSATLDRNALIEGLVAAHASTIQEATEFTAESVGEASLGGELPAVLEYRLVAPAVFGELYTERVVGSDVELADLDTALPRLSGLQPLPLGTAPSIAEGDAIDGSARSMDRSFWYLAFGTYLGADTAHRMSNELAAASLTATRNTELVTCSVATFDLVDPALSGTWQSALGQWVATAPAEAGPTVEVLGDATLQLRTCDPGLGVSSTGAAGIARALIGHRAAELATIIGVTEAGGSAGAVTQAVTLLVESGADDVVAELPRNLAPAALAQEARNTVSLVVASAAPASAPATIEPSGFANGTDGAGG